MDAHTHQVCCQARHGWPTLQTKVGNMPARYPTNLLPLIIPRNNKEMDTLMQMYFLLLLSLLLLSFLSSFVSPVLLSRLLSFLSSFVSPVLFLCLDLFTSFPPVCSSQCGAQGTRRVAALGCLGFERIVRMPAFLTHNSES